MSLEHFEVYPLGTTSAKSDGCIVDEVNHEHRIPTISDTRTLESTHVIRLRIHIPQEPVIQRDRHDSPRTLIIVRCREHSKKPITLVIEADRAIVLALDRECHHLLLCSQSACCLDPHITDRKSTRLNSSHVSI